MVATARPLLFAVAAVVTSFVFALWLSQHRLSDVETDVYQIAANAEPSVVYLENARTELERAGLYVDECVAGTADRLPAVTASRARATAAHDRLLDALAAYARLPFFPGEEPLYRDAQAALGPVDRAIQTVLERADAGRLDGATIEVMDDLHPSIERLDEKLQRIVQYDTAYAAAKLEAISASRRRSWTAAVVGGTISMALSLVATVAATWALWKAAEARRRTDEEHGARLAAEQDVHRRDQFLALVAHELRTPLTALKLSLDAAAAKPHQAQSPRLQAAAANQLARLNALVEELILVAQLDLGTLAMSPAQVDLVAIARERIAAHAGEAARAGSAVTLRGEAAVVGHWDAAALGQIVDKLLSNAIRYGDGRPIDVAVSRHGGTARLVVHDQGIGIPPHRTEAVFERFERCVSERNYPGLGLGLYVVRSLVRSMGGTVGASSDGREGSSFTVELPLSA